MSFIPLPLIRKRMMFQLVSEWRTEEMVYGIAYLVKYDKKYQKYKVISKNDMDKL